MKKNIAIIGAGAAGLAAAISAKKDCTTVTIYERSNKVGKKVLASGNGHCNITNSNISIENYHGKYPSFANIATKFDSKLYFNSLGLELKYGKKTRMYPMSDQASIVVDILLFKCEKLGIKVVKDKEIKSIKKVKNLFLLNADIYCDKVIIATGSSAMPHLGGTTLGYDLASSLGHKIEKPFASLVQLITDDEHFIKASGVKIESNLTLYIQNQEKMDTKGDILFTNYGVSGSGILDLSRSVSLALLRKKDVYIKIDLLPDLSLEKLKKLLQKRVSLNLPISLWFGGILNKKLLLPILRHANIPQNRKTLNTKDINSIAYTLKNLKLTIKDTKGYKKAEVMAGGIDTSQINPKNMESKLIKGLYFCGEVLDIDGDCGGYNLHWAWASGSCAGESASKD
ncbi:MAG: aminoacetone oxidase family FAD-binding enzyme [Epsilonproteobacteria bacterium]|nr:aminoacetone oxidase family FAD-binding enzyme [Campylobacterota bacterium]